MLELKVEKRDVSKSPDILRKAGSLPAVFYGRKEKSMSVFLSKKDFMKVWKEVGESTVISLVGLDEDKEALIQDVDLDPVSWEPRHADFYVIEKGKKLTVKTPLEFVGEAPAEKLGGTLVKVLHELEIEAMPKDLPHQIEVDVSVLENFEDNILASNIKLSEGITLITNGEEVVVMVSEVKEEEEEPVEAPDLSEIEVEQKGKQEEDGGEKEDGGQATSEEKSE